MGKKLERFIIKLTVLFMLQMFLSANTACARIETSTVAVSYLSPALNISARNFYQSFNAYFSEQAAVLKQADTTKARIRFNNDLYVLPFKSLFPQILQYQLLNTIKQKLLKQVSAQEISDIQVEYVSDDFVYQLFKQQGEKNLNQLIGNQRLKEQLLPIKQTRNKEWIALEGYNPPSKKRAKPETIEKYKRKWLLDSIPGITGYTKKELKEKATGALWIIYFQYKLCHEFGKRLLSGVKQGSAAEFKVNIRLKDGNELEAYITISGDKFNPTINQTLSFEQRVDQIEAEGFRQQMHTLQSQKADLTKVLAVIESLKKIKDLDLANWQNKVSAQTQEKIKQELTEIDSWLSSTPEYFNKREQEKYQARLFIQEIIKKQGRLAYRNFPAVIEKIESAINHLDRRAIFLFKGIGKRNIQLLEHAAESGDYYFYTEVIKNELSIARAAVKIDRLSIALSKLEYLESEILANPVFADKLAQNKPVLEAIKLIRQKLDRADDAKSSRQAIILINQVEKDKSRTIGVAVKNLQDVNQWFENKKLTDYAEALTLVIKELNTAAETNVNFYQVLASSLSSIDQLMAKISSAKSPKMNPGFKQIIINKFNPPKLMLKAVLAKVSNRNKAIKKVLPDQKLTGLNQAIDLLEKHFQQKSGYDSYEHMRTDLIEQMDYLFKALTETQDGFTGRQEFVRVGELIPGIINRLREPLYALPMVGQAI
ncbi:MAG: hypothetical protein V1747_02245 [Candidatus Omnitrophota bacterium]